MRPFFIYVFCPDGIRKPERLFAIKPEDLMESLKKNDDFRTCYRLGKSYADRYLVVYVMPNGSDRNRIGISVSKKVGNSVVRHRIKRLVHESYRLHEKEFDSGSDIAVIGRRSADGATYQEIERALLFLLGRAGIYSENF